jgi:hypothetical protein
MDIGAVADQRLEQRAAATAVGVVAGFIAIDHQGVIAFCDTKLVARDASERLERRPGGSPAIRTVAIEGVFEGVDDGIAHRAAKAFSDQNASILIC